MIISASTNTSKYLRCQFLLRSIERVKQSRDEIQCSTKDNNCRQKGCVVGRGDFIRDCHASSQLYVVHCKSPDYAIECDCSVVYYVRLNVRRAGVMTMRGRRQRASCVLPWQRRCATQTTDRYFCRNHSSMMRMTTTVIIFS